MNTKRTLAVSIIGVMVLTSMGCDTLTGVNSKQALRTMHSRLEKVEDTEAALLAQKSVEQSKKDAAEQDTLSAGRLEAARLGFGDYVVDPETGQSKFVWKMHLLGEDGKDRTTRAPQPDLFIEKE